MELDYWAIQQGFKVLAGATLYENTLIVQKNIRSCRDVPDEQVTLAVAADFGKQISIK